MSLNGSKVVFAQFYAFRNEKLAKGTFKFLLMNNNYQLREIKKMGWVERSGGVEKERGVWCGGEYRGKDQVEGGKTWKKRGGRERRWKEGTVKEKL